VIGLPPLLAGAVQLTVAEALPRTAVPMVGAPGATAAGVTALDKADAAPVPIALIALTWNRIAVPFVRPPTTRLVAPAAAGTVVIVAFVAELATLTE
jgi:hypothetical protein